ncbi:MAG: hypothetical protein ACHQ2E_10515 [Gemmatimonadales bacterium]
MFVGHTALAFAAKSRTPRTSLGLLYAAAEGLDILWPPLLLLGIERVRIEAGNTAFTPLAFDSYPWSHSLLMSLTWGVVLAAIMWQRGAGRAASAWVGSLVVSHWFLDGLTHRPDLPLWPGNSPVVGLGLWNSIPATIIVEGLLLVGGLALYLRATRATDRIGSWGLGLFVLLQLAMWISGPFAAPPPSASMVAWSALGIWLFVAWAAWIDRHRVARAR